MNGIETLSYLNKKYANNGVKFEDTGTAIKITDGKNSIYLNENPKDEKEADYLVKLNVQYLSDGMSKNRQLQEKFAFTEDEAMKYIEHFYCNEFEKRFYVNVDGEAIADDCFGYTATLIDSRKYNYYVTLYDLSIDSALAKELVKFDEMFDRISRNKNVRVEGGGYMASVFYNDKSIYKIDMLNERADEVEKRLEDKLNIKFNKNIAGSLMLK